jgi:hypothetical protein
MMRYHHRAGPVLNPSSTRSLKLSHVALGVPLTIIDAENGRGENTAALQVRKNCTPLPT